MEKNYKDHKKDLNKQIEILMDYYGYEFFGMEPEHYEIKGNLMIKYKKR